MAEAHDIDWVIERYPRSKPLLDRLFRHAEDAYGLPRQLAGLALATSIAKTDAVDRGSFEEAGEFRDQEFAFYGGDEQDTPQQLSLRVLCSLSKDAFSVLYEEETPVVDFFGATSHVDVFGVPVPVLNYGMMANLLGPDPSSLYQAFMAGEPLE